MNTRHHTHQEPAMTATNPTDAPFLRSVRDDVDQAAAPARLRTHWTADELMAMEFMPPVWAVLGIICEGVSLLCGPPKVGKSWASLGLGLSVAAGGQALNSIPVEGGPVLYLALEDTPRRLQSRMGKILGDRPAPSALTLATACPIIGQGGDEAIAGWRTATATPAWSSSTSSPKSEATPPSAPPPTKPTTPP
jgi:hypothetical protein